MKRVKSHCLGFLFYLKTLDGSIPSNGSLFYLMLVDGSRMMPQKKKKKKKFRNFKERESVGIK